MTDNNSRVLSSQDQYRAYIAGIAALLLWSGTAIANKFAVAYMDGFTVGVLRSMIAGFIALIVVYTFGMKFPHSFKDRALLVISGVSSFALWPILMSIGIEFTTAGHAAVIMALIPVITVLIGSINSRKLPVRNWWIGSTIALSATVMLFAARGYSIDLLSPGASIKGDFIIVLGGIICAIGYVAGGELSKSIGTAQTTLLGLTMTLFLLVPLFLFYSIEKEWASTPLEFWYSILWMALLSSLAGYALWFYALGKGGVGKIGTLLLGMPVLTLVFAAIFLAEHITLLLSGICLMNVLGVYLAQKSAK